ncbi:hypothetical protein PCH_Pc16g15100 [Penicillium rubens Wisconsin 54-1255]|uniref:Uncharacterized protein n=1 Tax=Penicillium rubens (strain ATCC 28089 / DSM 1075 / NRRL 1951 / Wisconsin 54-1255) TaxID=500485 RepID=B6HA53_PENRW|nr:hypothetical protein PCH_Pc16g15100 [Penicillium rubens Wisconsin 54-1255]
MEDANFFVARKLLDCKTIKGTEWEIHPLMMKTPSAAENLVMQRSPAENLVTQRPPARIVVDADLSCEVVLFSQHPPARHIDNADLSCGGSLAVRERKSYIAGLVAATAVVTETLKPAGKRGTP